MDWLSATRPMVIGHRGASAYAPENTLAAFALAVEQGADGIEFDVQLSADGWPVIIHDRLVNRTTNGVGKVIDLTVADLQRLDAGEDQPVPTLDDLFEMLGEQTLYNIEIKDSGWWDRGLETAVADRIQAHHLESHVLVSSFNPFSVRRARHNLTRSTPVALIRDVNWQRYSYWLGDGEADHPHHQLVNQAYMDWAHKRGYRTHVWTVDEPVVARRLVDLGVHAIISNKPDVIRQVVGKR